MVTVATGKFTSLLFRDIRVLEHGAFYKMIEDAVWADEGENRNGVLMWMPLLNCRPGAIWVRVCQTCGPQGCEAMEWGMKAGGSKKF